MVGKHRWSEIQLKAAMNLFSVVSSFLQIFKSIGNQHSKNQCVNSEIQMEHFMIAF